MGGWRWGWGVGDGGGEEREGKRLAVVGVMGT